jgi:hypothetical protein
LLLFFFGGAQQSQATRAVCASLPQELLLELLALVVERQNKDGV